MEKKRQKKKYYYAPNCIVMQVNETTNLMETSFPGQHNPASDGGTLQSESQSEEAKQTLFWQDMDVESETWGK